MRYWKLARLVKDPDERNKVEVVVRRHYARLKHIFLHLASLSTFPNIGWIDFSTFCTQCRLIEKNITLATIDRIFIAANVELESQADNPDRELCRFEFIETLVRIASVKFKETGVCRSFAEAFEKLLEEHVFPLAHEGEWQQFRDKYLWVDAVSDLLDANLKALKKVYQRAYKPRQKFMSVQQAVELLMNTPGIKLQDKDALYSCGMAKMTQTDETKGTYNKLLFVEFLEVLCRGAAAKFRLDEDMKDKPLATKLEIVLDVVLATVGEARKDPRTYVILSSESEDG